MHNSIDPINGLALHREMGPPVQLPARLGLLRTKGFFFSIAYGSDTIRLDAQTL